MDKGSERGGGTGGCIVHNEYLGAVDDEYLEVNVIWDTAGIALICERATARGCLLVCDRCSDLGQIIVAILTLGPEGPSFAICGPCFQLMPRGAVGT